MKKLTLSLPFLFLLGLGCNEHSVKAVEINTNTVPSETFILDLDKRVDVLFIIDNSGSMGEEQANLSANFGPLVGGLEDAGVDYRIGILTTDMGGCGNTPTGGNLRTSSCLDRPEDFVFGPTNKFQEACEVGCSFTTEELGVSEAWIESFNGVSNLVEGIEVKEAFQCLAPQGINGCGWESPLESMYHFLENPNGFFREEALLAIVILTDEADCSFQDPSLFQKEIFWNGDLPTSAICWNAGVLCEGDPEGYDYCSFQDYDEEGDLSYLFSDAMLFPVSKYYDQMLSLEKKITFSVIAGVPQEYPEIPLVYSATDLVNVEQFGIDSGCVEGSQEAVPPVRLKELSAQVGGTLYSVCETNYTNTIVDITDTLIKDIPPACYNSCVLDMDKSTEELDYSCEVKQNNNEGNEYIPECFEGEEIPEMFDACWQVFTGAERDEECQVPGQNLEFRLHRREGVKVPYDADLSVFCEASVTPTIDCK